MVTPKLGCMWNWHFLGHSWSSFGLLVPVRRAHHGWHLEGYYRTRQSALGADHKSANKTMLPLCFADLFLVEPHDNHLWVFNHPSLDPQPTQAVSLGRYDFLQPVGSIIYIPLHYPMSSHVILKCSAPARFRWAIFEALRSQCWRRGHGLKLGGIEIHSYNSYTLQITIRDLVFQVFTEARPLQSVGSGMVLCIWSNEKNTIWHGGMSHESNHKNRIT